MFRSILPISSVLASTFFMLFGVGLSGYLIPLRAVLEGWPALEISLVATGYSIAFTAGCLITPRLVMRVGHVRVFAVLAGMMSISLLLHSLFVNFYFWIFIRAIAGFSVAGGYMVLESWLNEQVTNENRGSVFSIYMTVSMVGIVAGQFMVTTSDPLLPTLFIICAVFFTLALVPTGLSRAQSPQPLSEVSLDIPALVRRSPMAAYGSILAGVISSSYNNMAPVYAQQSGLSISQGATMLVATMMGAALFQIPIGRLSDMIDRRYVMAGAGFIGISVCTLLLFFGAANTNLFFILVFLLGSVLYPIYSLNISHANDHAEPDEFVETASGLLILYGGGTMIGPLLSAGVMDAFGASGIFVVMAVSFGLYALYALYRTLIREQASEEERVDFQSMPFARIQTPQTYEWAPGYETEEDSDDTPEPIDVMKEDWTEE